MLAPPHLVVKVSNISHLSTKTVGLAALSTVCLSKDDHNLEGKHFCLLIMLPFVSEEDCLHPHTDTSFPRAVAYPMASCATLNPGTAVDRQSTSAL